MINSCLCVWCQKKLPIINGRCEDCQNKESLEIDVFTTIDSTSPFILKTQIDLEEIKDKMDEIQSNGKEADEIVLCISQFSDSLLFNVPVKLKIKED